MDFGHILTMVVIIVLGFIVSNNSNILINKFYDKMIEYWRERNEIFCINIFG